MSYVTANECIDYRREPCAEYNSSDLQTAIDNAETNVDTYLKYLGVDTVPLTLTDITDEFKKAVITWVIAELHYANNNLESGNEWRKYAETMLKRFVETHEFANTETTIPSSEPGVYNYSDDITDFKEPRDV